jgi:hypothetical protein
MKKFGLALFPLPPLSILESLKCLEEITWQMLPPVLTQNAKQFKQITWQLLPPALTQNTKQFRTNYLAAAASGIDTKCEAI